MEGKSNGNYLQLNNALINVISLCVSSSFFFLWNWISQTQKKQYIK